MFITPFPFSESRTSKADLPDKPEPSELAFKLEHEISPEAQYTTHLPVYDLKVAAGGWGEQGAPEVAGWTEVIGHQIRPGMFVAQVVGPSMEPRIPSGSWCLFAPCPAGSRQGRLLLVQIHTHVDPQDGGRYTIKRYRSTKRSTDDGWEHQSIELQPLNPEFPAIPVDQDNAEDLRVLGEFKVIIK